MTKRNKTAVPPPPQVQAWLQQGIHLFQAGHAQQAAACMEQVLRVAPRTPDALHILGLVHAQHGRLVEAERLLRQAVAVAPAWAMAHNNLGNVLAGRGDQRAALREYSEAARLEPAFGAAHYNRGNALRAIGQLDDAVVAYRRALALQPDSFDVRVNLGNTLRELDELDEAEALYREALARRPNVVDVWVNIANLRRLKGDLMEARAIYERVLQSAPGHGLARLSLGLVSLSEGDLDRARQYIEGAQDDASLPKHERLFALAQLRQCQGQLGEAASQALAAVDAGGDTPRHYFAVGKLLTAVSERERAAKIFETSQRRFGDRPSGLFGEMLGNRRYLCDWRAWDEMQGKLLERIRQGALAISPLHALATPGLTPLDHLEVARAQVRATVPSGIGPLPAPEALARPAGRRIRIGYVSADFHEHATAYLMASVFERHDRKRFETVAYSLGKDDGSAMRRRLEAAFDRFVDLRGVSSADCARRIQEDGIDILVDLKGHTRDARPDIFARRPAPIQVNWVGYPGSVGMSQVDYIIVDPVIVPPEQAEYFDEHLAYLPDCYLPVDDRREVAPRPSRADAGLPDDAFVFCCFNNSYKITPQVFTIWCDLLKAVPDAVLWLFEGNETAAASLRREARARGVAPERLVFAAGKPQTEHLARIPLADLFLDTLPYNAHTTASDALWMGLPVLTCAGDVFPARVAASLVSAAGVPELITHSFDEYRERALHYATHRDELATLRERMASLRSEAPFYDSTRFARNVEDLFRRMWARHVRGEAPSLLPPGEKPPAARAPAVRKGRQRFAITTVIPPGHRWVGGIFREVSQMLCEGLQALGHDAQPTTQGRLAGRRHIVLASNFWPQYPVELDPDAILYNLEQIFDDSMWMKPAFIELLKRHEVWDYSRLNVEAFRPHGIEVARLLPIGYAPGLTRIEHARDKDIDVLLIGAMNDRRMKIIDDLNKAGYKAQAAFNVFGRQRDALIARARLMLNVHALPAKVLEVVRLSYWMANGCAILSEPGRDPEETASWQTGVAFAEYDQLVDRARALLGDPAELDRLGRAGFDLIRARPIEEALREALA